MYSKRSPDRNASSAAPKSKALTFCSHHLHLDLDILDHVCTCTAYKPSSLHVSPNKSLKMKPEQKILKNGGARHVDLWHDVSQTFSCLHEIHLNDLCQFIRPHQTCQANSTLPTPGGRKSGSHWVVCLSEAVKCRGTFRHHGGTVDTEAAAAAKAAEDVHSIGHVAPYGCVVLARCGRRSARRQLTPAIGLPKVAEMYWSYKQSIDLRWLRKIQSRFWLYKNGVGHLPAIYLNSCLSSFLTSHWSLRWVMGWDAITTTKR